MQILLKGSWEFLQGIFSKWRYFHFDKDFSRLFNIKDQNWRKSTKSTKLNVDWTDPYKLFAALCQHKDTLRYPIPPYGLQSLIDAWNHVLKDSQIIQEKNIKYKIKDLVITW